MREEVTMIRIKKHRREKVMEKRAKRLALVGLAAAMTAALLSGCGGKPKAVKATPENLLRDMADRVDDIESVLMNIQFGVNNGPGEILRERGYQHWYVRNQF